MTTTALTLKPYNTLTKRIRIRFDNIDVTKTNYYEINIKKI